VKEVEWYFVCNDRDVAVTNNEERGQRGEGCEARRRWLVLPQTLEGVTYSIECACSGIMACSTYHVVVHEDWFQKVGEPCEIWPTATGTPRGWGVRWC